MKFSFISELSIDLGLRCWFLGGKTNRNIQIEGNCAFVAHKVSADSCTVFSILFHNSKSAALSYALTYNVFTSRGAHHGGQGEGPQNHSLFYGHLPPRVSPEVAVLSGAVMRIVQRNDLKRRTSGRNHLGGAPN